MSGLGSGPSTRHGAAHARSGHRAIVWATVAALVIATALVVGAIVMSRMTPVTASVPASTEAASPPPLSTTQQMLLDSDDPQSCAVTFEGEGLEIPPVLQHEGQLYTALPIPDRDGAVFAGWYATPEGASALDTADRVNGSEVVTCDERERTLYAAWTTPDRNAAENAAIPILMYHQFTTNPEGEEGWLRLNYAYIGDFEQQIAYIADNGFYLPTWDELSAFIDGRLFLPAHSVIVTDDDADSSWLELAVPVVDEYEVLTTSFVITKWRTEGTPGTYVLQRSHTHDMHEAGANGEGRMVNYSADQIAADLEQSAQILGAKEVIAYPFGHYNDTAKQGVTQAGFELARTIDSGYVRIGTDKLALPAIRMNYGMTVGDLAQLIG